MSPVLAAAGLILIGFTLFDVLWTTIAPRGSGPLTKRIARGWWTVTLWIHRRRENGDQRLLAVAGPAILVAEFLVWVGLLWTGWVMLFSSEPASTVGSPSNQPADLAGRIYYTGFVLFTLGTGDYVPEGGTWEILSALASLSGLVVVTLAITYVLSIVSAVAAKRQLAESIHSLGATPVDILRRAWDGRGFPALDQHLPSLGSALAHHEQRHSAFPVIHYFHSGDRWTALSPAVAVLDETLLLLAEGVSSDVRPPPAALEPARRTVGRFLDTLGDAFIEPSDAPPPAPDLEGVSAAEIPVERVSDFRRTVERLGPRRRLLRGLLEDGGWRWETAMDPNLDS